MLDAFETQSATLQSMLLVMFQAPTEDVDRIMAAVTEIIPLVMGKYDSNSYQAAEGVERYRPLQGAAAGPETELRKRPGVVEVFSKCLRTSNWPSRSSRRSSRHTVTRSP